MDITMFVNAAMGELVDVTGSEHGRDWRHKAFLPAPLSATMPALTGTTFLAVGEARAAVAALDAAGGQLPNPTLLRSPALKREAQSTSALEGTYAPLQQVLVSDDEHPASPELQEVMNYVAMAGEGISWVSDGRPITSAMLCDLQGLLMRGTPLAAESGRLRERQVVIGQRLDAAPHLPAIQRARFVPAPPGDQLAAGVAELTQWLGTDHAGTIDPVVAVGMAHYQFETLHPFRDGNGRLGRFLIMQQLMSVGLLREPTLTVSPWFESRRSEYYDALLGVSTRGDWDTWLSFFSRGLAESARATLHQLMRLVDVQKELKEMVRASHLRADTAMQLVDLAVANTSFTAQRVATELDVSYGRANALVKQFVELGLLELVDETVHQRRFYAPRVLSVFLG